ncbi:hypothetical protein [Desulfonatronum parangueonense]
MAGRVVLEVGGGFLVDHGLERTCMDVALDQQYMSKGEFDGNYEKPEEPEPQ